MLSGAADIWARLWPEGEPNEVDDEGRLLEEITSFLARAGDPPRRASTRERAASTASTVGCTPGTRARERSLAMVSVTEADNRLEYNNKHKRMSTAIA